MPSINQEGKSERRKITARVRARTERERDVYLSSAETKANSFLSILVESCSSKKKKRKKKTLAVCTTNVVRDNNLTLKSSPRADTDLMNVCHQLLGVKLLAKAVEIHFKVLSTWSTLEV